MRKTLITIYALILAAVFCSCTEKETELGLPLHDPATIYNGVRDTAWCDAACMVRDDSMLTVNYGSGLLGNYADPSLGTTEAIIYTQVTFPYANNLHIDASTTIDSVTLTLVVSAFHQGTSSSADNQQLHIEVKQLAEGPITDTPYYDHSELPVSDATFFDGNVPFCKSSDTVLRMRLNDSFKSLLQGQSYTQDQFRDAVKGIRIRMLSDAMATINFNAARTCITAYLRSDTVKSEVTFNIGAKATHFNRYVNQFDGPLAPFAAGADTIAAADKLYLLPMAGCNVRLDFGSFVRTFHQNHPHAAVHYAELLLPVENSGDTSDLPDQIVAYRYFADGSINYIADMTDPYRANGFDGKYDAAGRCYRLRVTQHIQKLLLAGNDYGTLLSLNARRSSPARVSLGGPQAARPLRIEITYTE